MGTASWTVTPVIFPMHVEQRHASAHPGLHFEALGKNLTRVTRSTAGY